VSLWINEEEDRSVVLIRNMISKGGAWLRKPGGEEHGGWEELGHGDGYRPWDGEERWGGLGGAWPADFIYSRDSCNEIAETSIQIETPLEISHKQRNSQLDRYTQWLREGEKEVEAVPMVCRGLSGRHH
jgi:hypothetical protein